MTNIQDNTVQPGSFERNWMDHSHAGKHHVAHHAVHLQEEEENGVKKTKKKKAEETAKAGKSSKSSSTASLKKDVLLTAGSVEKRKEMTNSPLLGSPDMGDDPFLQYFSSSDDEVSTIAILGKMAALVAQADSQFRQIMWDQDTQTMQIAVKFAPLIAQYVQAQANKTADATMEDAEKEKSEGIGTIVTTIVGTGMGAMSAYGNLPTNPAGAAVKDAEAGAAAGVAAGGAAAAEKSGGFISSVANFFKKVGLKESMKGLGTIMSTQHSMLLMGQGMMQLAVAAPHDTNKSHDQAEGGSFDAAARKTEGYQAFYNQSTDRGEKTVNAADQNHGTVLNTYKSASDGITNALVSAWNKI